MPDNLTEARERIIKLFTELKAEGVDIQIVQTFGGAPSLGLWGFGDLQEIRNRDWHPEWVK